MEKIQIRHINDEGLTSCCCCGDRRRRRTGHGESRVRGCDDDSSRCHVRNGCRRDWTLFHSNDVHSSKLSERTLTLVVIVGAVATVVFTVVDVVLLLLVNQILKRQ